MKEKEYLKDNKELMIEWNYAKNENIDLKSLTLGMNKKVWWKCEYGHEWEASIAHRSKGRNFVNFKYFIINKVEKLTFLLCAKKENLQRI